MIGVILRGKCASRRRFRANFIVVEEDHWSRWDMQNISVFVLINASCKRFNVTVYSSYVTCMFVLLNFDCSTKKKLMFMEQVFKVCVAEQPLCDWHYVDFKLLKRRLPVAGYLAYHGSGQYMFVFCLCRTPIFCVVAQAINALHEMARIARPVKKIKTFIIP